MSFMTVVVLLSVLAFVAYQIVGVVKDVKKNRQKKKETVQEEQKTE